MKKSGSLFIVATPIGNMGDITFRAIEILKYVDLIAAEDTRHSARLLNHYGINVPLLSLHEHNESQRISELISRLKDGKNIALISDAGTPLVSDPGYRLVQAVHHAHLSVVPIPGACAAISALVVSGLSTDRFVFEGFLPAKGAARRQRLLELSTEPRTVILYEAPHRIENLLEMLVTTYGGERLATIARELTKTFETIRHDTLANLQAWVNADPQQRKGEFVVVLQGAQLTAVSEDEMQLQDLLNILLLELPLKQAVSIAAKISKQNRNQIYRLALEMSSGKMR